MKLENITLRNFKSIGAEEQSAVLAPITLLFGPNSAGKSTILQSLVFLREIIEHRNLDPDKTELGGEWVDLGGFLNLVHNRDPDNAIEIKADISLGHAELDYYLNESDFQFLDDHGFPHPEEWLSAIKSVQLTLFIAWSEQLEHPQVERYEISINGELLASIKSSKDGKQIYIDSLNMKHNIFLMEVDIDGDGITFSNLFEQSVDHEYISQPRKALDDILSGTRPFKDFIQNELEEFVDSTGHDVEVLKKIQNELEFRTTRSAHNLSARIDRIIAEGKDVNVYEEKYIGLLDLNDALVNKGGMLQFDPEIWDGASNIDSGVNEQSVQLLIKSVLSGLIVGPLDSLSILLSRLTYIGPLRDLPQRDMTPQRTPDISRWAKGLAAWELLFSAENKLIDEINKWLGEHGLDTGYEVIVKKYRELDIEHPLMMYLNKSIDADIQALIKEQVNDLPVKTRVSLRDIDTDIEMKAQDVGVGISQLLPVIILSIFQKNGIIAIEQPELHIHPKLQVELADLFISQMKDEGKIFILETHSEHLMLRLLKRIREYYSEDSFDKNEMAIPKESVSVIYVESENYGSKLSQQQINENGDFDNDWPDGFFEERDEELFF